MRCLCKRSRRTDATGLPRGPSRSSLQEEEGRREGFFFLPTLATSLTIHGASPWDCGCHGLAPWCLTFVATEEEGSRIFVPLSVATSLTNHGASPWDSGCHGLAPWIVRLAATTTRKKHLFFPSPQQGGPTRRALVKSRSRVRRPSSPDISALSASPTRRNCRCKHSAATNARCRLGWPLPGNAPR